ncbi:molybdopterin-dependent oxidoreductase [Cohnella lubricantis]|uniref:Molybdopterin-dependent oxidoreductase n=1 Tax=Cohnella lubricantis TaxID=2163172 RepID=A0A841TGD3_9BACL|nr:molybdopterin-dependent oxidoreductase [Cohnella lubricantis]MBB6678007.1 molybdopterin-dependent oxidoreductase [Cohnella lubricantis]MBP2118160.1 hypothetical protein [Cohnella lubricantis]
MRRMLDRLRKGFGRKLAKLHTWNGWMVFFLALTGLMLALGFWRSLLGEGRVWIKWLHIGVGIASIVPVLYYLLLAGKHWKQLRSRPWQRFNVLIVLVLLLGWFASGAVLWQFRLAGPRAANAALLVHDILSWAGLPYVIYHSLTRLRWLKEPHRRTVKTGREPVREPLHPAAQGPLMTRRAFIRGAIGVGLAVTLGPSFLRWISASLGGGSSIEALIAEDANRLTPAPTPLPQSSPPIGGGAQGSYRVYTVTRIPAFSNENWSFTIDGLVEHRLSWNWTEFVQLPRTVQVSDFHCVTGWSVYRNTWEGIKLKELLKQAGVKSSAKMVKFYSGDGVYTDSLTLDQADMDDVLVAVLLDGKLIPSDLGGPARLIVPKMYGYKSVKWLNRIELIPDDHVGYWEERGYSKDAWV